MVMMEMVGMATKEIPEVQRTAVGEDEEPQGDLEQAIGQVWREAFKLEKVGRSDNFFELGGSSLLALDLSEMLMSRLEIDVPVLMIFLHPTVREIAAIIEEARAQAL
jgi:acyl carrier protein